MYKIYFDDRPLFLSGQLTDELKVYAHHDDAVHTGVNHPHHVPQGGFVIDGEVGAKLSRHCGKYTVPATCFFDERCHDSLHGSIK